MGIPSYFSYIVKNHNNIIKNISNFHNNIHNLYFDSNSIIYDCYRIIMEENNNFLSNTKFENYLIQAVCDKITSYINIIKPIDTIIISFDGVAPVAKMNQQRSRRLKSTIEKKIMKNFKNNKEEIWNKTAITPGTEFMKKLNNHVCKYFKNKEKKLNVKNIIISGSNIPGEGEHKIFDYIKNNKIFHFTKTTVVYGLDADLIMLAINHLQFSKNIFLYRETPEFIKSIDKNLDPNETYILDIPLLSNYINNDINNTYKNKFFLQDYIFIFFLLGNDFLPHFPSLNIRTNGIKNIFNAYIKTISCKNNSIINNNEIQWKYFKLFITELANNEHDYIKNEYNIRNKKEKRTIPNDSFDNIYKKYLLTPIFNRTNEIYINPYEGFWENRYYKTLFHIEPNEENIKKICINYLEGLEWTFKYYTFGCPDWCWKYNYHYPPLLKDLIKYIPMFNTQMVDINDNKPVDPLVQLIYVLPKESLYLLPKKIYNCTLIEYEDYYNYNVQYVWDFCTYIWESHVDLPPLHIPNIQKFIKSIS
jgi:5'-3' exoribonuclease 1